MTKIWHTCDDLVIGLGEIGKPILELLKERGLDAHGYDITDGELPNYKVNIIHICFPYNDDFIQQVKDYKQRLKPEHIIIHSTVNPGTSFELDCVYSPVRGIHENMLEDLKFYKKYYAGPIDNDIMKRRFNEVYIVDDRTKLEWTKIIVDTTYWGYIIAFRKMIDQKYNVDWSFAEEINLNHRNRPIPYNDQKPIGGHCVIPNLKFLQQDLYSEKIKELIEEFK